MGFTTAAFIRKNTPELRKKLEELGYKCSSLIEDRPCLFTASYLIILIQRIIVQAVLIAEPTKSFSWLLPH